MPSADAFPERAPDPPPLDATSSAELLVRARAGDSAARESLYRRYLLPLKRWSQGRLPIWARDLVDTDDIVQDTLLRTLGAVDRFDPRHSGAFAGYMRRIVDNRLRDELRRAGRRPVHTGTAGATVDPGPDPLEEAIGSDTAARYERALGDLKPEEREAIVARVELGFSYQKVAESLGKPSPDAARMATSRALLRLAKKMADGTG